MKLESFVLSSLVALTGALAIPAGAADPTSCPGGQIAVRGECVAPCPTAGTFPKPDACECPPGYGKILHGGGGGECRRLACATGVAIDPAMCDCPRGLDKKGIGKGKARCVAQKATAKAK